MGNHSDGLPTGFVSKAQSDGRKWIAHLTTGSVATVLSLLLASFLQVGGPGPAGPAGPAGKPAYSPALPVQAGVCAYFGPDSNGRTRFQLSTPTAADKCHRGVYVSVVPRP
jgi:hypothetical protein